ncbi:hypothetical protein A6X21_02095 [Planctopirus hydrillae]|uniref:Uncharacterized protein n=1 Tax=Planctopirus hydrillae TaxID=1841610 RepID=A0A1C3ET57_9PLAN|nr:hypothetical protein A6X21_02095 [Planctopirus hydrillae]
MVPVPEAAMHKDDCPVLGEHDIRFSGQILAVQSETISHPVEQRSYDQLWLRVPISDAGHVPASVFR